MTTNTYSIRYPRRLLARRSLRLIGRVLFSLFADVEINGKEKLPKKGPVILAGNHVAVLEAALMAVYSPGIVEFLGNGDIPFDPKYAFIAHAYDLIPVNRGNLDRESLHMGLDVLNQNGILGIFPEGGIWDPAQMQGQIGVAWLSYRAQAPIIPIGFGGIKDGLGKILKFKRPKLVMNVGNLIPPVSLDQVKSTMKENLQKSANQILSEINALVPEEDLEIFQKFTDETYHLEIEVFKRGSSIQPPKELRVKHGAAYARFLYNPTMMDVLVRNLNLPIKPIKEVQHQRELEPLLQAWKVILNYLKENPGYFTYRFGVDDGLAVKKALLELRSLAKWAQEMGYGLTIEPVHYFCNTKTGAHVIERGGCFPKSMDAKPQKFNNKKISNKE